jgi:HSP20 family protein
MSKEIDVKHQHNALPATNGAWHTLRQEMDQLFDRFSDGFESISLQPFTHMQRLWSPGVTGFAPMAVDVAEGDKAYTITAELPGVNEKDVDVSVDEDMLVIKGEKHQEKEEKSKNRYVSERSYGAFQRMFSLPRGTDATKIEARFQNGVLTVSVPKTAQKQEARKVEVKAA